MSITSKALFILASESPRRRDILESVGLKFKIVPAYVNEDYLAGESPQEHVKRLSRDKAMVIASRYPEAWVLGADTTGPAAGADSAGADSASAGAGALGWE